MDRPTLEAYQAFYVEIFIEIKDGRGYSAGGEPLPLSLSEILAYCELYYIESVVERERIVRMVKALDASYRKVAAQQAAQQAANKPTS